MLYLTAPQLAELTGYSVNQYACMRRWLERNRWPFAQDRAGLPKVLRAYHDQRMNGQAPPPAPLAAANAEAFSGPRFDALKSKTAGVQHHGRKKKIA